MRRLAFALSVFLVLLFALWLWARHPLDDLPPTSEAKRLFSGAHAVRVWETEIEDTSRGTPPHGSFAGSQTRRMKLRVWQSEAKRGPLLVYSHGFGSERDDNEHLMHALAKLGYVCAAPSFPATSDAMRNEPLLADVASQPADQRFVIDRMLAWNETAGHALEGKIDPERIGAVGMSLGGLTTILLAFDPARKDDRIKAVVSIAGLHSMFDRSYYTPSKPFMEVAADRDAVVPYATNARRVAEDMPGALLVTVADGSHSGFIDSFAKLRFMPHPDLVACAFIMRSLKKSGPASWPKILGESTGLRESEAHLCEKDILDLRARDPREQQRIASFAVIAFVQSQLAADEATRNASDAYLRTGLVREFSGVSVH